MTNAKFDALFDGPARTPEQLLTQREMDLAASVQDVLEDVVLAMGRSIAKEQGQKNLCLAGGVALNCVANGKLLRDGSFDEVWIQPAAGDAGRRTGRSSGRLAPTFRTIPRTVNGGHDAMAGSYLRTIL